MAEDDSIILKKIIENQDELKEILSNHGDIIDYTNNLTKDLIEAYNTSTPCNRKISKIDNSEDTIKTKLKLTTLQDDKNNEILSRYKYIEDLVQ